MWSKFFKRQFLHSGASFTAKQTRTQTSDSMRIYELICTLRHQYLYTETSVIETEKRNDNFFGLFKFVAGIAYGFPENLSHYTTGWTRNGWLRFVLMMNTIECRRSNICRFKLHNTRCLQTSLCCEVSSALIVRNILKRLLTDSILQSALQKLHPDLQLSIQRKC